MTLSCKIPREVALACSGGGDSMGALWFLTQKPDRVKQLVFINHGTPFSEEGEGFVKRVANKIGIPVKIFYLDNQEKNAEAIWHDQRNDIFQSNPLPIITAHNLDDQVEQYMMTTIKCGKFKPIPSTNNNIYRPFLFMTKPKLEGWAVRLGLGYLEDPTNYDIRRHRAYVRHLLVPSIRNGLGVELRTVVRKLLK